MTLWHHYLGLTFGLLTLTWVASGLLSMNPWGLLEPGSARSELMRLREHTSSFADAARWSERVARHSWPAGTKRIEFAPLLGANYLVAYDGLGNGTRYETTRFAPAPLTKSDLQHAALAIAGGRGLASATLMESEDAYYYSHHTERRLPVYRVVTSDEGQTRYYLDPISGELRARYDSGRRWYRWLFEGLHRMDFSASLRRRPVWDSVMLLLMTGVTGVCVTGTYLGARHLLQLRRRANLH